MEMRKEVEVLVDTVGLDDTLFALADHADAMALRLAALERGATVETKPATVAVAPKVWPVGSKPPPGVGQVRRGDDGFTYRIVCVLPVSPCAAIRTDRGWLDLCGVAILAGAPLLEPWTEPAATPDPRIAELEARIRELEAKNHAQGVGWRAAEDRCREANERVRAAESRIAALTAERDEETRRVELVREDSAVLVVQRDEAEEERDALRDDVARLTAERDTLASQLAKMTSEAIALREERDAAVKRAEGAEGARVERVAVDTTHIPNPVAPGSVVCPNCERDITLSAHAGASEGA